MNKNIKNKNNIKSKKVNTKKYRLYVGLSMLFGMIIGGFIGYFSEKKETMFGLGIGLGAMLGSLVGIVLYIKFDFNK